MKNITFTWFRCKYKYTLYITFEQKICTYTFSFLLLLLSLLLLLLLLLLHTNNNKSYKYLYMYMCEKNIVPLNLLIVNTQLLVNFLRWEWSSVISNI